MRACRLTFALVAACTSLALAAEPPPVALCPRVNDAPTIDGSLADAAWGQAEALRAFQRHDGSGPASEQTNAFLCSDGKALFIACTLRESAMDELKAEDTAYDSSDIFRQDVVEVFLRPDLAQEQYFHLAASAAGVRYDAIATGGAQDWNPTWRAATSRADDRWTLEVAIPLSEVDLADVEAGRAIGLNICREEKPHDELSCWSPTLGPFHTASRFGEVIFFSIDPLAEARIARAEEAFESARKLNPDAAADLAAQLDDLRGGLAEGVDGATWAGAREQLAALREEAERIALAGREAIVYRVNPWALPAHTELPARDVTEVEQVTVRLLQDEYETVAIGIANPGEASLAYHVSPTDLLRWEADEEIPVEDRIQLREAVSLKTRTGGMVRDALAGLGPASRLVVPGGQNAMLWLTVHARDLEPGRYLAGIDLLPMIGEQRRHVRLNIQVHPARMKKGGPPWLNTWAYLRRAADFGWEVKAAADLDAHYCNINMIRHGDIPWPTVDAEGNMTEPLDFTEMDARIELMPAGFYLLNLAMHWHEDLDTDLEPWSPEHKRALGQWAVAIRDHLAELDIDRNHFAWYPRDEPSTDEQARLVRNFAEALHEADPQMAVFANPFSRTTFEQIETMGDEIDIWCPNLSGLDDEEIAFMRETGDRMWSYRVLSRLSNPYGGYRAPWWRVRDLGMTAYGYWAYDSIDGDCWDDSDGRTSDYAVYYEGEDGPTSSVRWEASREGSEDYRYMQMLDSLIAEAREAGHADAADKARAVVDGAMAAVLGDQSDRSLADAQHAKLLAAMMHLQVALGRADADALARMDGPLPVCVTGNAGPRFENLDVPGWYTYSTFPTHDWDEQCEATEGRVWFDGADATEGPQTENGIGGDLVDGSWFYRRQYVNLWHWSPSTVEVTFDLQRQWPLTRVDLFAHKQDDEQRRISSAQVLVSETGEDGSFEPVAAIEDAPAADLGAQGQYVFDVDAQARFVKIIASKEGPTMVLGEVRIWAKR